MMQTFLGVPLEYLIPAVGLAVAVVIVVRGLQIWNERRSYGHTYYQAEQIKNRLLVVGAVGISAFVCVAGTAVIGISMGTDQSLAEVVGDIVPGRTHAYADFQLTAGQIGVHAPVVEVGFVGGQWDVEQLTTEVGHLAGSAYPGQAGNVVLAGHVTIPSAGWGPFQELDRLEIGDDILIEYAGDLYAYRVVSRMQVDPSEVRFAMPTSQPRLTLVTCANFEGEADAGGQYTHRLVIIAEPVDETAEAGR